MAKLRETSGPPGPREARDREEPDAPEERSPERARELALRRLSLREHSGGEMRTYLRRKGFPPELAASVVQDLTAEGLIDDRRYARALARDQSFRDKGPRHVLMKLRQKGVRIELKETLQIYGEIAPQAEGELVRSVLERRYPRAHADEREYRRAYQGLIRRGFSPDAVRAALGPRAAGSEEDEPGLD